jgi:hypothetical protein
MQPTTAIAHSAGTTALPGGVVAGGVRGRGFAFRPPTGELEMRIAEMPARAGPAEVTALLSAALAGVGGEAASAERAERLCVADRQYLLRALAIELGQDETWVPAVCADCGQPFDARVVASELPVREAVEFPETSLGSSRGRLRVRVPDGADQAAIAGLDSARALAALAARLVVGVENGTGLQPWTGGQLGDADIEAMNARMDEVFPAIATRVRAPCPDCGTVGTLDVSPLRLLRRAASSLYRDVYILASYCHWSEADILGMPRGRRMRYVRQVDRARGFLGE